MVVGEGGVVVGGLEEEDASGSRANPKGKRKRGVGSVGVATGVSVSVDCWGESCCEVWGLAGR